MPHTHINQNKDNKRNDCYFWICGMPTENIFLVKKKKKKSVVLTLCLVSQMTQRPVHNHAQTNAGPPRSC